MPGLDIFREHPEDHGPKRGLAFPGFIRNFEYHTTEINVFEDGVFDAWGALDLDFLGRKIEEGWIAPSVPDGREISMFSLGQFDVEKGDWIYDPDSLYAKLWRVLQNLNPGLQDICDFEGSDVEIRENGVRYAKLGGLMEYPCRYHGDERIRGQKVAALVNWEGDWFFTQLRIYRDGLIDVHPGYNQSHLIDLDELVDKIEEQLIAFELKEGTRLHFDRFGSSEMLNPFWFISASEFLKDVKDILADLTGEETAGEKCRRRLQEYHQDPCDENREKLRRAYQAVPEHRRRYLGSMDSKDWEYRRILGIND